MSRTVKLEAVTRGRVRVAGLVASAGAFAALLLLSAQFAGANPDHSAGDYFMFAKVAAPGTTDPKAFEPSCDASNHKQADFSGSSSFVYGRIHSNADVANSGAGNTFVDSGSPNTEITYGVNDNAPPASPPDCQLQAEPAAYNSGAPTNIIASGNPAQVDGPYQIGLHGWPGNLGSFLNADGETFGNDVTQVLPGATCGSGTSLTDTDPYEVQLSDEGKVICNGTGLIKFGQQGLGTLGVVGEGIAIGDHLEHRGAILGTATRFVQCQPLTALEQLADRDRRLRRGGVGDHSTEKLRDRFAA